MLKSYEQRAATWHAESFFMGIKEFPSPLLFSVVSPYEMFNQ